MVFQYLCAGYFIVRNREKIIAFPGFVLFSIKKVVIKVDEAVFEFTVEAVKVSIDGATLVQNQCNKMTNTKFYGHLEANYQKIKPYVIQVSKYKKFMFLLSISFSVFNALIIISDHLGSLEGTGLHYAKTKEAIESLNKKNENWAFKFYRLVFKKVELPSEVVGQRLSKVSQTSPGEYILQRILRAAGIVGIDQIQQNYPKVGTVATDLAVPVIGSTDLALNWKRLSLDTSKEFGVFFSYLHIASGVVKMYMNGSVFTPLGLPLVIRGITCLVTRTTTSDWVTNKTVHPLVVKNPLFLPLIITLMGIETGAGLEFLLQQPEIFRLQRLLKGARNKNEVLKTLLADCTSYIEEVLDAS
jgi:hypothetical protein